MKGRLKALLLHVFVILLLVPTASALKSNSPLGKIEETATTESMVEIRNINILTDDDFAIYATSGNGTEIDPYIIENYHITSDYPDLAPYNGIRIEYTTKYLVIRNCVISRVSETGTGISMDHVGDDRVKIINNVFEGNMNLGISLFGGEGAVIANNTFLIQGLGLWIEYASNSIIANNTFSAYGIRVYLDDSSSLSDCLSYVVYNNTVGGKEIGWFENQEDLVFSNSDYQQLCFVNCTNITVKYQQTSGLTILKHFVGISLFYCQNANISENTCGIEAVHGENINVLNNYFTDTGMRISCVTAVNVENNHYKDGFFNAYLYQVFSGHINNNSFGFNEYLHGLYIVLSHDCTIENNYIVNNGESGLSLYYCSSLTIRNNEIYDSERNGLYLRETDNCQFYHNVFARYATADYGTYYGISVQENSAGNSFYSNIVVNNKHTSAPEAIDNGVDNYWYNTSSNSGNYWYDWSESGSYDIDGTAGASDPYPLIDTDADGMAPDWEIEYNLDPWLNDANGDADGDGLTNLEEYLNNANPLVNDTDSDGLSDYEEVNDYETKPDDSDSDDDDLSDKEEVLIYFSDPNDNDTDGDGMLDGYEVENGYDPLVPDAPDDTSFAFSVVLLAFSIGIVFRRKRKLGKK